MPAGMWAPGAVGLVVGLGLLIAVKDSPEKIGYPPVEIVKTKVLCLAKSSVASMRRCSWLPTVLHACVLFVDASMQNYSQNTHLLANGFLLLQKQDASGNEQKETLLQLLVKNVLKNPYIWGMALTYFFIYVVRQGVTSWFVFYLMKVLLPHLFLTSKQTIEGNSARSEELARCVHIAIHRWLATRYLPKARAYH